MAGCIAVRAHAAVLVIVTASIALLQSTSAAADDGAVSWTEALVQTEVTDEDLADSRSNDDVEFSPECEIGWDACTAVTICEQNNLAGILYAISEGNVVTGDVYCARDTGQATLVSTILKAFRAYSWPASGLDIQPVNNRTAVNFPTYFATRDTATVAHTFTLVGVQVTVEATPSSFTWVYGDGEQRTTTSPGGPYPDGDVTHEYRSKGTVRARLDTTYTGRYRVGGGAWTALPGTHTVRGASEAIEVIEIRPTLVAN